MPLVGEFKSETDFWEKVYGGHNQVTMNFNVNSLLSKTRKRGNGGKKVAPVAEKVKGTQKSSILKFIVYEQSAGENQNVQKSKPVKSRKRSRSGTLKDKNDLIMASGSKQKIAATSPTSGQREASPQPCNSSKRTKVTDPTTSDPFDALLDVNAMRKPTKTYVNSRRQVSENTGDFPNKAATLRWLNDNTDLFDRFSPTQNMDMLFEPDSPAELNLPSISQVHATRKKPAQKQHKKTMKQMRRARSLECLFKKARGRLRIKSRSCSESELVIIESDDDDDKMDTLIQTKAIVDFMEESFIKTIEGEANKGNGKQTPDTSNGWKRMKEMKRKAERGKFKKLNVSRELREKPKIKCNPVEVHLERLDIKKIDDLKKNATSRGAVDLNAMEAFFTQHIDDIEKQVNEESNTRENSQENVVSNIKDKDKGCSSKASLNKSHKKSPQKKEYELSKDTEMEANQTSVEESRKRLSKADLVKENIDPNINILKPLSVNNLLQEQDKKLPEKPLNQPNAPTICHAESNLDQSSEMLEKKKKLKNKGNNTSQEEVSIKGVDKMSLGSKSTQPTLQRTEKPTQNYLADKDDEIFLRLTQNASTSQHPPEVPPSCVADDDYAIFLIATQKMNAEDTDESSVHTKILAAIRILGQLKKSADERDVTDLDRILHQIKDMVTDNKELCESSVQTETVSSAAKSAQTEEKLYATSNTQTEQKLITSDTQTDAIRNINVFTQTVANAQKTIGVQTDNEKECRTMKTQKGAGDAFDTDTALLNFDFETQHLLNARKLSPAIVIDEIISESADPKTRKGSFNSTVLPLLSAANQSAVAKEESASEMSLSVENIDNELAKVRRMYKRNSESEYSDVSKKVCNKYLPMNHLSIQFLSQTEQLAMDPSQEKVRYKLVCIL